MPTNHNIQQVRQDMLQGQRPSACKACWNLEDAGISSDRLLKNRTMSFYKDVDTQQLFDQCVANQNTTTLYKIDTSNTCNATCVYCSSLLSSSWASLERKNNKVPAKSWRIRNTTADTWINYATATSIIFRGGEPLLSATNFHILEQLIAHNNTRCFISFVTNGSVTLSDYQLGLIAQFPNKNFCFSIDGVGPVFEYVRYPLKWDAIEKNLEYCKSNNIPLTVSYTLTNINVWYHAQTINWFQHNNLPYHLNLVHDPAHFHASVLPQEIKQQILSQSSCADLAPLLNAQCSQASLDLFFAKLKEQDEWKGIHLQDYLPEIASQLDY
jgi:sulfatase maturation enzyme AslB (radical SAM superfamily)